MRILVADNDIDERNNLINLIEKLGHVPVEAVGPREVVDCFRKKAPDLALIDFTLGGKPGVDIVKQVRGLGGVAAWNPIILTANKKQTTDDLITGIEAGADDYFIKPIDPIALQYKIRSAERQQDLKDQVFTVAHDLVVANRALESMITHDAMTGIANSNSFEDMLEREWFEAKKNTSTLSLLLIDIDFFQTFNRLYGSEKGDEVIIRVADALKRGLPDPGDFIARTTGATFAILLPHTEPDAAIKLAQALKQTIEDLQIPHSESGCSPYLTVSIGVSSTDKDHFKNPWDLMESADYAIYQAKHSGRNKVKFVLAELVE